MKKILKIDKSGYLQFGYDLEIDKTADIPFGYTDILLPTIKNEQMPFYKPKLVDGVWVEDMTQEEIDELNNQPKELTEIEQLKISQAEQFETILELLGGMM